MSLSFGSVVLVRFPFTDLSGQKLRPALVISADHAIRDDVVLAFVTSKLRPSIPRFAMLLEPTRRNGLKIASLVRFDKITTIESRLIIGRLGDAEPDFLRRAGRVFFGGFGFPSVIAGS